LPLETGELPKNNVAQTQTTAAGKDLCCQQGAKNVNVEKNATAGNSVVSPEHPAHEETHPRYTSDSYQKILDYRVGEILFTTIILAVILLLRLHH